jgi:hypothetical protein
VEAAPDDHDINWTAWESEAAIQKRQDGPCCLCCRCHRHCLTNTILLTVMFFFSGSVAVWAQLEGITTPVFASMKHGLEGIADGGVVYSVLLVYLPTLAQVGLSPLTVSFRLTVHLTVHLTVRLTGGHLSAHPHRAVGGRTP